MIAHLFNYCQRESHEITSESVLTRCPPKLILKSSRTSAVCALALLAGVVVATRPASGQRGVDPASPVAPLERIAPAVNARLVGLERAQGVLFGALIAGNGKVDEADLFRRMNRRLTDMAGSARPDAEADRGFAALGSPADTIIRRAYAFQREIIGI